MESVHEMLMKFVYIWALGMVVVCGSVYLYIFIRILIVFFKNLGKKNKNNIW